MSEIKRYRVSKHGHEPYFEFNSLTDLTNWIVSNQSTDQTWVVEEGTTTWRKT